MEENETQLPATPEQCYQKLEQMVELLQKIASALGVK